MKPKTKLIFIWVVFSISTVLLVSLLIDMIKNGTCASCIWPIMMVLLGLWGTIGLSKNIKRRNSHENTENL